ncbi:lipoprotein-releasing ABC transporter permease subunit [Thalassotalea sp. LPB0316]|uniref:lipoprotein-releasing ABC transporter permease subunit n=1 Tax=Thalassotalea sp. LPB0316 TaxID=2769490 RepID=UPI001868D312|nr:lipoprotein-releasing ABC transporter permease subunit [Thalassotalea sp. LPB0316]QOL24476.1 lipoprotein-releasing ABC transporter permease subunit [Thalassotalea sp. LPB0316]
MLQPVSLFIGLRYSKARAKSGFVSFITFFSIIGILLGVSALITVVSVMNGFEGELKKRVLGIVPHVVVSSDQAIDNYPTLINQAHQHPRVKSVSPIVESEALIQSPSSLKGILLTGILPDYETTNMISEHTEYGDFNALNKNAYHIVIGRSLARQLSVNLGDEVRVVLPNKTRFTPMGRVPVQRVFKVVGLFNVGSQIDDSVAYIHLAKANRLLGHPTSRVSQLRFYLDDAFVAQQVVDDFAEQLSDYQVKYWQQSQGALFNAVKMEKRMMWLMLSLIVAVAAFNIVSALVMVVIDKQGEISILQTLGLNRLDILKIFITQGMVNGLWGTFFGTLLGLLVTFNINDLLAVMNINLFGAAYGDQQLPILFQLNDLATIIVGALALTLLATLYPAYRASRTMPAQVLKHE